MTEPATDKQKGFMRKLGFDESTISLATKDSAKMLISAKLEEQDEDRVETVKPGKPSQNQAFPKAPAATPNGHLTMYVSYAKDLCIAMLNEEKEGVTVTMERAVNLVKQAQRELSE